MEIFVLIFLTCSRFKKERKKERYLYGRGFTLSVEQVFFVISSYIVTLGSVNIYVKNKKNTAYNTKVLLFINLIIRI